MDREQKEKGKKTKVNRPHAFILSHCSGTKENNRAKKNLARGTKVLKKEVWGYGVQNHFEIQNHYRTLQHTV